MRKWHKETSIESTSLWNNIELQSEKTILLIRLFLHKETWFLLTMRLYNVLKLSISPEIDQLLLARDLKEKSGLEAIRNSIFHATRNMQGPNSLILNMLKYVAAISTACIFDLGCTVMKNKKIREVSLSILCKHLT